MKLFHPSVDWAGELGPSLLWVLVVSSVSAACIGVLGYVFIRFSPPGQRFWRITGDYFTGRASLRVWGTLAILLVSVIVEVRLEVLLSFQGNDVYSAPAGTVRRSAHRECMVSGWRSPSSASLPRFISRGLSSTPT
jgi:vitamin B12/bleomycin/antimicrobial peptide transport system ATP-binding/permease protein